LTPFHVMKAQQYTLTGSDELPQSFPTYNFTRLAEIIKKQKRF